jgi:rhamnose transport system permease protein
MTLIVLTGGIDLSVGATMSLAAVALGLGLEAGAPVWACVLAALATGSAAGLLNAVFVARFKIHPLIVTLATMSAFFGLAEGFSHARAISGFSNTFTSLSSTHLGLLPLPGWVVLLVIVTSVAVLGKTVAGQALYAIGLNETASRFSGITTERIKLAVYTLSGTAAGMAAVFYAARRNTAKADIGQGLELDVVTAVVLGGTSIYGGKGGIVGTVLGVLLVHETRQFVSWHWEKDELNLNVIGLVLILSVLANRVFERGSKRAQ